jgi:limonene-1,2-epoxide hydrolase
VLTERTDIFDNNGKTMSVDVIGVFELKDGKIHAWREYFDTRALAPAS